MLGIKYMKSFLVVFHDSQLLHIEARCLLLESGQAIYPVSFSCPSNRPIQVSNIKERGQFRILTLIFYSGRK